MNLDSCAAHLTETLFERFSSPTSMLDAEQELLALGEAAVPILESLFTGQAKNRFGVPYRQLGLPLRCALEVVRRLGPVAKPLEHFLRSELRDGHSVAAMALASLGSVEQASITELVANLTGDIDLSYESAAALIRCRQGSHPLVLEAVANSGKAAEVLAKAGQFLSEDKCG